MISFLKEQKFLILFAAGLFCFHWFSKDIRSPYERPIAGDAQAYYAYLPAIFIYHDLDYSFMETEASKYYAEGHVKDFVKEVNGEKVNKTFPGVALLYTAFFAAAHICALVFGLEADGFSTIYQLWFDLGHWCYFLFGLIFLKKILEKLNFSSKNALFSTVLIGIGTNLFFYTVYDQSVTHVHNFFLINGLLLTLMKWRETSSFSWLILSFSLLALIGITRPTNILVFGLIFFFFNTKIFYSDVFRAIFSKNWWKITLFVLPIISLPFVLWKMQTGNWIVYSYGEEGFDFSQPHFFEFIFSYTKGWMTYTPLVIPVLLIGLILLFRQDKRRFAIAVGFYLISIYVFSSWWCWYYGAGMSQRVMIDHYVLLAFLLATIMQFLESRSVSRNGFITLCAFFTFLNVAQAWQIKNGIIQFGSATKEQYWDNFLNFERRARVYPKEHWTKNEDFLSWNEQVYVDQQHPFSASLTGTTGALRNGHKLIFSFECLAHTEVQHARAVLLLHPEDKPETEEPFVYYFSEYVQPDQWVLMEFLLEPQINYLGDVSIYFWNAGSVEMLDFRNVKVEIYFSEAYY